MGKFPWDDIWASTSFMTKPLALNSIMETMQKYRKEHNPDFYCGLRIITDVSLGKMVQARTHKKKRINKKWRKRFGFKSVPDGDKIYVIPPAGVIVMHPGTYEKLKKAMKNCNQKEKVNE